MADSAIREPMTELAKRPPRDRNRLKEHPAFGALRDAIAAHVPIAARMPEEDLNRPAAEAAAQALQRLGYIGVARPRVSAEQAADLVESAISDSIREKLYCIPLDLADEMPDVSVGPAQIRRFDWQELFEMSAQFRPSGVHAARDNCRRLAEFQWLTVRDSAQLPDRFAHRVSRTAVLLDEVYLGEMGRIEPHAQHFPEIVETTLGALLTLPWEDVIDAPNIEWRPFRVRWMHTYCDDLFAPLRRLPNADTLSWEPCLADEGEGDIVDGERPATWSQSIWPKSIFKLIEDDFWKRYSEFTNNRAAPRPITHFLVRAFMTDGIDEFLAHIITIEALGGLKSDYFAAERSAEPRITKKASPTERMAWRVAGLLNDPGEYQNTKDLYDLRSKFIHGRKMEPISAADRLLARTLARRCVATCLNDGVLPPDAQNYEEFLQGLMRKGHDMV